MAQLKDYIKSYLKDEDIRQLVLAQIAQVVQDPAYVAEIAKRIKAGLLTTDAPMIKGSGGQIIRQRLDINGMVEKALQQIDVKIAEAIKQRVIADLQVAYQQVWAQVKSPQGGVIRNARLQDLINQLHIVSGGQGINWGQGGGGQAPPPPFPPPPPPPPPPPQQPDPFDPLNQPAGKKKIPVNPAALGMLPGGATTRDKVMKIAGEMGFTEFDLDRIVKYGKGLTDIKFKAIDSMGALNQLSVTVGSFGEIIDRTQRRFQPFGDAVAKDALEFMKWSIAISLILIPMQKLGEMANEAITNQTKLADVAIALGDAQKSVNEVFKASYDIANQTGEAVGGVIDAYALAYRAAGGAASNEERFATAGKLLSDSLILSKLSALDQAEAIDILSAALKQSSKELERLGGSANALENGQMLLDSWVKTTRIANVSLETLATSFSIVSDAAGAAGLSIYELNGVIAVLSEATGDVSGKEIGNMARALVSGFQSDKAARQLQSLGIAIQDVSGEARSFMDVYGEIANLRQAGILSDTEFNKITLAIGGGTRRQAIVQTFIENFGRISQVSKESADSSGSAMMALQEQLDTVATASTRLANAFSSLAQTLGTKGGILDMFTSVLNVATSLVKVIDKITGSIGKSAPMLAMVGIATGVGAYYKNKAPAFGNKFLSGASSFGTSAAEWILSNSSMAGRKYQTPEAISKAAGNFGSKFGTYGAMGAIGTGVILASNLSSTFGDEELTGREKAIKATTQTTGTLIGAGIAAAINPMLAPMGAAVGASISEAFLNNTVLYKEEWSRFFGGVTESNKDKTPEEVAKDARKEFAQKGVYAGQIDGGKLVKWISRTVENWVTIGDFGRNLVGAETVGLTREQVALALATREAKDEFIKLTEAQKVERIRLENRPFTELMKQTTMPEGLIESYRQKIMRELLTREITPTVYKTYAENLKSSEVLGQQYYAGFGQKYGQDTGQTKEQVLDDIIRIATYANAEELNYLTSINSEIAKNYNILRTSTNNTTEYNTALAEYNRLVAEASQYTEELNMSILARKNLPEIVDFTKYETFDIRPFLEKALAMQGAEYSAAGFTAEEYAAKQKSFEPFLVKMLSGYSSNIYNLDPKYLQEAVAEGAKEGIIQGVTESNLGFQTFDMTSQEFFNQTAGYEEMLNRLMSVGYDPDYTELIPIFQNGILNPMEKDWKVVQYLLGNIDKNTKELTGIYNLPSDATFWIPSQAAELWKKTITSEEEANKQLPPLLEEPIKKQAAVEQIASAVVPTIPETEQIVNQALKNALETPTTNQKSDMITYYSKSNPYYDVYAQGGKMGASKEEGTAIEGLLKYFTSAATKEELASKMGNMFLSLNALFDLLSRINFSTAPVPDVRGTTPPLPPSSNIPDGKSTLNLSLTSTTQLVVDGRQMANVVKRYLKQDLSTYTSGNTNLQTLL